VKRGDLITVGGLCWLVARQDGTEVLIVSPDGNQQTVPARLDIESPSVCKVIANPTTDWPFIVVKPNIKKGLIVAVYRPLIRNIDAVPLKPFEEYIVGEPLRSGGAIYLNPALNLRPHETLLVAFQKGQTEKVVLPPTFGTINQKVKKAAAKAAPKVETVYDRLLNDPSWDDDD